LVIVVGCAVIAQVAEKHRQREAVATIAANAASGSAGSQSAQAAPGDDHAAGNAAIEAKRKAQPSMTSIQIVPLAKLVDEVYGHYRDEEDSRTLSQLDWTLVAISGVVDLRDSRHFFDDALPEGAEVDVHHAEDGTPDGALVFVRTDTAWTPSETLLKAG
jgi:hypothetical protein